MPVNSFDNYPMTWKPNISKTGEIPLYIEVAQALERDVRNGQLKPNDKLPPQRELADYLDVNLSTIARAFKLCTAKGLISGEVGRGTYVSSDVLSNLPMLDQYGLEHCINLGASHPLYEQNKYVVEILKHIIKKANISSLLEYSETSGRVGHKQSGQRWLSQFGVNVPVEQVLITSGLQNSLAIILTSLFHFGDKIVTNSVVYPGIKNIANSLGIQLIPMPYIGQRMNLDYLHQLCKNEKIKGIYVNPDHQNPTTIDMSEKERTDLSSIIKQYGLICIEDATYSFLSAAQNTPITSIVPQQSIYISTVSNSLSAGLRVAFLTMPLPFLEKLKKGNSDINVMSAPLEVEITSQLIRTGVAQKIIQEKIICLQQRNKLVDRYLSDYQVQGALNSQFRWLPLPLRWTGKQFEMMAKEKGVQVFCCERFIVGSSIVEPAVRLAISTPKNMDELELGLQILRKLLE